jgi:hypothetical protein
LIAPNNDWPFHTLPNKSSPGPSTATIGSKAEVRAEEPVDKAISETTQQMLLILKEVNDIEIEAMEAILKVLIQKREHLSTLGQCSS